MVSVQVSRFSVLLHSRQCLAAIAHVSIGERVAGDDKGLTAALPVSLSPLPVPSYSPSLPPSLPHSLLPSLPPSLPPSFPLFQHEGSTRTVDDSTWEEIRNFKKCVLKMAAAGGKRCLFLETALGVGGGAGRQRQHCHIDAIPVEPDIADEAPIYFKKVGAGDAYCW